MRCKFLCRVLIAALVAVVGGRAMATSPETPEERRHRLETMSAAEKEDLLRKKERFERLPEEEQARLRKLHEQVTIDPQSDKLKHVLTRYCDWLKTLSAAQRAALESLPVDERIPKIKELMKAQEVAKFKGLVEAQLPPEDLKKINDWLEEYVTRNEGEIIAKLPQNNQRWIRAEQDIAKRHRQLRIMLFNQWGGPFLATLSDDELKSLLGSLKSTEAQKALDAAREPEKKRLLAQRWIGAAIFARFNPPVSDEELQRFYAEDLDSAKREQLELMPREEMQRELRKLYYWHKFRKANEGQRPFGGPFGVGPGGPGTGPGGAGFGGQGGAGGPGFGGPGPGGPGVGPGGQGSKEPRPPFGRGNDQGGPRDGGQRNGSPRDGRPREEKPAKPEVEASKPNI